MLVDGCIVSRRIRGPGFSKAAKPELTGIAVSAGGAVGSGIVAARRQSVINSKPLSQLNDLALGQVDQRRSNRNRRVLFGSGPRGEIRHLLVGANVLRPAVGIAAVVQCVHTDEDLSSVQ